jgi:hypothetical protein
MKQLLGAKPTYQLPSKPMVKFVNGSLFFWLFVGSNYLPGSELNRQSNISFAVCKYSPGTVNVSCWIIA